MIDPIEQSADIREDWRTINECVADINGVYDGIIIPSLFGSITGDGDRLVIDLTPLQEIIKSIQDQLVKGDAPVPSA